ncbi:MAG: glycosyltransferase family 2 protein [Gammaproteobacteria bacterium]|jgi:GT2 family glycosyltransferase|nr:glycosyltransferase family 2 protein [Bacteroidetes Order II. bacterium]MBT6585663.1 glycosyltransferase family 2 protein [Gammaproteobacteria bacterium]MBT7878878.1 glycosyltransferase family 2 protein [Gammaproteobacteria bacterium]
MRDQTISVIIPTIGRPSSLERLLASIAKQTYPVREVIVADGSSDESTRNIVEDPRWRQEDVFLEYLAVLPPDAVRQREMAIQIATGDWLLLLDDDVELELGCVSNLVAASRDFPEAVAVMADFSNEPWAMPTRVWRFYLRFICGLQENEWQGRVVGPLLRYGFLSSQTATVACQWFGTGNSLVSRDAFERAGGFSDFFLHRSSVNEDVDLSMKVARQGTLLFCPSAKLAHFHDPAGRVAPLQAAEDDLYNRYQILHRTMARSAISAFGLCLLFFAIETLSNAMGGLLRWEWSHSVQLMRGRLSALWRICKGFGAAWSG